MQNQKAPETSHRFGDVTANRRKSLHLRLIDKLIITWFSWTFKSKLNIYYTNICYNSTKLDFYSLINNLYSNTYHLHQFNSFVLPINSAGVRPTCIPGFMWIKIPNHHQRPLWSRRPRQWLNIFQHKFVISVYVSTCCYLIAIYPLTKVMDVCRKVNVFRDVWYVAIITMSEYCESNSRNRCM